MVWLFELPFIPSLLARLALFFLFAYIPIANKETSDKIRPFIGKLYYWGAFAGNIGQWEHTYWIIYYMKYNLIGKAQGIPNILIFLSFFICILHKNKLKTLFIIKPKKIKIIANKC